MTDNTSRTRLLAGIIAIQLSVCASAVLAKPDPAPQPGFLADAGPAVDPSSQSVIAELQQRVADGSVRELRASVDGDYGTALLLADDKVLCYVALLYQNKMWRVLRFDNLGAADAAYRNASKQNGAIAGDAIRRQVLATQLRQYERAIEDAQARAEALNNDMRLAQAQRLRMAEDQKTSRAEVQTAELDSRAARAQLEKLRREIRRIESSLADSREMLPVANKSGR
ncbi:DUF2968 domain-containing protein [Cupriavidus alkaliphilus]|uniref:DUF2968 domain-containing protein n=1 Tax=Cupriavidus alkaliphilus TaxID=942866 RepID=UPI000DC4B6B0|nr:DUF2968 domain-containing protein [Cupriavidus alkaliphilus]MBB3015452.1 hypothetical protein [Cupriavidus alkaliphilus]RAS00314.1 hypothetical protein C7415_1177 [Cupriavidus alkaliphilus]